MNHLADAITALFCTLCIAAGWFYLARSRGVERLAMLESPRRNATRRKVRRMGAWAMMIIGAAGFWMMFELGKPISQSSSPVHRLRLLVSGMTVFVALITMVLSALIDMYLTMRLRQTNRPNNRGPK